MPQIDWTPEFKRTSNVEFDRLKLKVGEKARIVILDKPTFAWVHTLRAPKIVDGRASKVIKRRKDGTEFADWDMDFVGRPQCLGDYATIAEDGIDPVNCPVCARAKESEECTPPERRFAMNVIRYNTRADGTLVNPFGCSSLVWNHTEGVFNKLHSIAEEYARRGGVLGHDLILGPCQAPEAFQKFDIAVGADDKWNESEEFKRIVLETHKNNKVEDLEATCGRKVEKRWLDEDINKIRNRWKQAHGQPVEVGPGERQEVANLKGELDNLLATPPAKEDKAVHDRQAPLTDGEKREASGGSEPEDFSGLLAKLNL